MLAGLVRHVVPEVAIIDRPLNEQTKIDHTAPQWGENKPWSEDRRAQNLFAGFYFASIASFASKEGRS